ncbi:hypothetical protein ACHHYP_17276 [Achlya hypogyna]|uniref:Uncharacterized protein n=1 Tax=Achlya hypogyna TaxID=1202772 RepID=A0A1V9Y4T2_ACHHY|nr:hypothetical protein ACHHYP_17276 [Achlya hypogyna]
MLWVHIVVGLYVIVAFGACGVVIVRLRRQHRPDAVFQFASSLPFSFQLTFRVSMLILSCGILVREAHALGVEVATDYTEWSFLLLTTYFLLATAYQIVFHRARFEPVLVPASAPLLNTLFDVSWTTSLWAIVLYWTAQTKRDWNWHSYAHHGATAVVCLIEFIGNHFLVQPSSAAFALLLPAVFIIVTWVGHGTWLHGVWPYPFMNMETAAASVWYLGFFMGHGAAFVIVLGFSRLKETYLHVHKTHKVPAPATSFQYSAPSMYYVHLFFRLGTLFLYFGVTVAQAGNLGVKMLSYYTVWNFLLQAVYFIWAIKYQLSTFGSRKGLVAVSREGCVLNAFFDICFANSILVIIIYWGLLYNPKMLWYSYIQHGGNTLLLLLDFWGNRFVVQTRSVVAVLLFPTIYGVFVWISNVTWLDGWWPYYFLKTDEPTAPLWVLGVFAGHFAAFAVALGISTIKVKLTPQLCPVVEEPQAPVLHGAAVSMV